MGNAMARIGENMAPAFSTVDTTGLADVRLAFVLNNLVTAVPPCTIPALPPPIIIPKTHLLNSLSTGKMETERIAPAIIANGVAMVSNKLSTTGI